MADDRQLDRRVLRRTEETLASDVSLIASEFLAGFQAVHRIDRPAVSIFARPAFATGHPPTSGRARPGRRSRRRFAVVTEEAPASWRRRTAGARRRAGSVGFIDLPHEQGAEPVLRHRTHVRPLLRAEGEFVKAAEGFVIFPGGRHPGRAVGGADTDPDREDRQLRRARRLRLLGRAPRVAAGGDARRRASSRPRTSTSCS